MALFHTILVGEAHTMSGVKAFTPLLTLFATMSHALHANRSPPWTPASTLRWLNGSTRPLSTCDYNHAPFLRQLVPHTAQMYASEVAWQDTKLWHHTCRRTKGIEVQTKQMQMSQSYRWCSQGHFLQASRLIDEGVGTHPARRPFQL